MKLFKKLRKGFTLIELVVVIAVIAILSAVAVVSYVSITNRAKQSNDQQKVDQVNLSLQAAEIATKAPETMHEALRGLKEEGFLPENFKAESKDYQFAYSLKENKFVILKSGDIVYPKGVKSHKNYELWLFADSAADVSSTKSYSHYLRKQFTVDSALEVEAGLDVGYVEMPSIKYVGSSSAQEVTIRTNDYATILTIDAKLDTVHHFGYAKEVKVDSIAAESYHENGRTATLKVAGGHIVLESEGRIGNIHLAKNDVSGAFKNKDNIEISIDLKEATSETIITRDEVEIPSEGNTFVAKVNDDYLFLHGNGTIEEIQVASSREGSTSTVSPTNEAAQQIANVLDSETNTYVPQEAPENLVEMSAFSKGTGTEDDPYIVKNYEDLCTFRDLSNDGNNFGGKFIKLGADITLKDSWTPISNYSRTAYADMDKWFAGNFSGLKGSDQAYSIKGLTNANADISIVNKGTNDTSLASTQEVTYGLFGSIKDATIDHIELKEVKIQNSFGTLSSGTRLIGDCVGALAGHATGACNFSYITVDGEVEANDNVGGIVGRTAAVKASVTSVAFANCKVKASVSALYEKSGKAGGITTVTIKDCSKGVTCLVSFANCEVTKEVKGAANYVAGIAYSADKNYIGDHVDCTSVNAQSFYKI